MPQNDKKRLLLTGSLLCLAAIIVQALDLESKLKTTALPTNINIVAIVLIAVSVGLAILGAVDLTKAITYKWDLSNPLNFYPRLYRQLLMVGVATVVIVISLAIRFNHQ